MPAQQNWDVLNCSRKRTYGTTEAAREDAVEFSASGHWERPLVPYHCTVCGKYHLTSAKRPDQLKRVRRWRREWEQGQTKTAGDS